MDMSDDPNIESCQLTSLKGQEMPEASRRSGMMRVSDEKGLMGVLV